MSDSTGSSKAVISGPGENYVQSTQNDKNIMVKGVFESSSPENQTVKPRGVPVTSYV